MQDPLKQGLKHGWNPNHMADNERNSNARSIKTRIETAGLKKCILNQNIRMQDPLKQGLKPVQVALLLLILMNSNARSIKTRIETGFNMNKYFDNETFECKIH